MKELRNTSNQLNRREKYLNRTKKRNTLNLRTLHSNVVEMDKGIYGEHQNFGGTDQTSSGIGSIIELMQAASNEMNIDFIDKMLGDGELTVGSNMKDRVFRSLMKITDNDLSTMRFAHEYFDALGIKAKQSSDDINGSRLRKVIIDKIKAYKPMLIDKDNNIDIEYTKHFEEYLKSMTSNVYFNPESSIDDALTQVVNRMISKTGLLEIDSPAPTKPRYARPFKIVTVPMQNIKELTGDDIDNNFIYDVRKTIKNSKVVKDFVESLPIRNTNFLSRMESNNAGVILRPYLNSEYFKNTENRDSFIDYVKSRTTEVINDNTHNFINYESIEDPVSCVIYVPLPADRLDTDFIVAQICHMFALIEEILIGSLNFKYTTETTLLKPVPDVTSVNQYDIYNLLLSGMVSEIRKTISCASSDRRNKSTSNFGKKTVFFNGLIERPYFYDLLYHESLVPHNFLNMTSLFTSINTINTGTPNSDALQYPVSVYHHHSKSKHSITLEIMQLLGGEEDLNKRFMRSSALNHSEKDLGRESRDEDSTNQRIDGPNRAPLLRALAYAVEDKDGLEWDALINSKITNKTDSSNSNDANHYNIDRLLRYLGKKDGVETPEYRLRNTGVYLFLAGLVDLVVGTSPNMIYVDKHIQNNFINPIKRDPYETPTVVSVLRSPHGRMNDAIFTPSIDAYVIAGYVVKKGLVYALSEIDNYKNPPSPANALGGGLELEDVSTYKRGFAKEYEAESLSSMIDVRKHGYSDEEIDLIQFETINLVNEEDRWMLMSRIRRDRTLAKKNLSKTNDPAEKATINEFISQLNVLMKTVTKAHIVRAFESPTINLGGDIDQDIIDIMEQH